VSEEDFEEEIWRIRTDEEIRELYKMPHMVKDIKRRRVEWLGRVSTKD
jgi:hypothetical protein